MKLMVRVEGGDQNGRVEESLHRESSPVFWRSRCSRASRTSWLASSSESGFPPWKTEHATLRASLGLLRPEAPRRPGLSLQVSTRPSSVRKCGPACIQAPIRPTPRVWARLRSVYWSRDGEQPWSLDPSAVGWHLRESVPPPLVTVCHREPGSRAWMRNDCERRAVDDRRPALPGTLTRLVGILPLCCLSSAAQFSIGRSM